MFLEPVRVHRFNRWVDAQTRKFPVPFIGRCIRVLVRFFLKWMMRMVWGCEIHFTAEVGKGTLLGHYGLGVVVGQAAKIGERVLIKQNVTIGISGRLAEIGTPRIGDDVYIGTGAKILGPITIGSGSVIGANSVVTMDIPPNSLVVGIPGRISKSNINRAEYWPPMM